MQTISNHWDVPLRHAAISSARSTYDLWTDLFLRWPDEEDDDDDEWNRWGEDTAADWLLSSTHLSSAWRSLLTHWL